MNIYYSESGRNVVHKYLLNKIENNSTVRFVAILPDYSPEGIFLPLVKLGVERIYHKLTSEFGYNVASISDIALRSLKNNKDIIIFVFDPCGLKGSWTVEFQNFLVKLKARFGDRVTIIKDESHGRVGLRIPADARLLSLPKVSHRMNGAIFQANDKFKLRLGIREHFVWGLINTRVFIANYLWSCSTKGNNLSKVFGFIANVINPYNYRNSKIDTLLIKKMDSVFELDFETRAKVLAVLSKKFSSDNFKVISKDLDGSEIGLIVRFSDELVRQIKKDKIAYTQLSNNWFETVELRASSNINPKNFLILKPI